MDEVVTIRRRGGRLREVVTAAGRSFLVAALPGIRHLLVSGAPIGDDEERLLEGDAAGAAARDIAERLLAARDRTEAEMRDGLRSRGVAAEETIEQTISALRERGLVDDRRFAGERARFLAERKKEGPGRIRDRLRRAGIDGALIDEALGELPAEWQRRTAEELARSRISTAVDRRTVRRVNGYLSRRGFDGSVVADICARIMRGELKENDHER